jgi:hypothetical protein
MTRRGALSDDNSHSSKEERIGKAGHCTAKKDSGLCRKNRYSDVFVSNLMP